MIDQIILDEVIRAQKQGEVRGIASICSANPFVLEASLLHSRGVVLIESTCNQVNQYGGYTGMTPADFVRRVGELADKHRIPRERVLIGGDHLGPNPWKDEPADRAMEKARVLVRECVRAGYVKIHLDASMRCADDSPERPLDEEISAQRAAELARVAEDAFASSSSGQPPPRYVIGTEVPPPGGIQGEEGTLSVTPVDDVARTIEITRAAFLRQGLEDAWERVIAVVVQPGVEYGDQAIFEYQPERAAGLSRFIERHDRLIYEAHSTDYQTREALRHLVRDHFAILKVGPALTFAFREAVFALAMIEEELPSLVSPSRVREALEAAMLANPAHWAKYYSGTPDEQRFARRYSLSDRSRYYWPVPAVQKALSRLLQTLSGQPIPLTLLSQYLPLQYRRVREGTLENAPRALIMDKIGSVLADYAYACGEPTP